MNSLIRPEFCIVVALAVTGLMDAADRKPPPAAVGFGEGFHGAESARADWGTPPASPEALRDFQARRFGLFVNWGPVSLTGRELGWARGDTVPAADYDQLYRRFNPAEFNADEWVHIAKAAGMRYIVFDAKHLDGFCLWHTRQTDYSIMQTPFKRDVVRELADACRRECMLLGIYYSIADWYNPWFAFSGPYRGPKTTRKPTADAEHYNHYMMSQLAELLTSYGPIECLWFDSMAGAQWPEQGRRLIQFARALQPAILVNNRSGVPGDYVTPEERIGRYRDDHPWESCMMIGTSWSWKPNDTLKSRQRLLQALIYCAGGDGNFLLNVGPSPRGVIDPPQVERLKEMGDWLGRYGESIYATRGGPYKPTSYLASTRRGNFVYLHITRWDESRLILPPLPRVVVASTLLTGGTVRVRQTKDALTVEVAPADRQPIDTLVRLELDGPALDLAPIALPPEVMVTASATREPVAQHAAAFAADNDPDTEWSAPPGQTTATLELTFARSRTIQSVKVEESARPTLIQAYAVTWWNGERWVHLLTKNEAANQVARFSAITTRKLRIEILKSNGTVAVSEVVVGDVEK